jgi:hypothetical protein
MGLSDEELDDHFGQRSRRKNTATLDIFGTRRTAHHNDNSNYEHYSNRSRVGTARNDVKKQEKQHIVLSSEQQLSFLEQHKQQPVRSTQKVNKIYRYRGFNSKSDLGVYSHIDNKRIRFEAFRDQQNHTTMGLIPGAGGHAHRNSAKLALNRMQKNGSGEDRKFLPVIASDEAADEFRNRLKMGSAKKKCVFPVGGGGGFPRLKPPTTARAREALTTTTTMASTPADVTTSPMRIEYLHFSHSLKNRFPAYQLFTAVKYDSVDSFASSSSSHKEVGVRTIANDTKRKS